MGMQAGVDDDSFGHWSSCYVSYKGKGRLEIMMGLYSGDCCNGGSVQFSSNFESLCNGVILSY